MLCLTGKKLLLRQTPLAGTLWTPQNHLRAASLSALQMCLGDVCERLNEDGAVIQAFDTLNTLVAFGVLTNDLLVKFVQCLDVVAREGDGYEEHVCVALFHVLLDSVGGLCSEPRLRADL